ncbi:hypothetical protein DENSPDRAFT_182592 [Dentipellis sp. KUC8613]|nr:hypothetical protein DENSPDRAFT_182592 [Dentipellis sp. KUC8613]
MHTDPNIKQLTFNLARSISSLKSSLNATTNPHLTHKPHTHHRKSRHQQPARSHPLPALSLALTPPRACSCPQAYASCALTSVPLAGDRRAQRMRAEPCAPASTAPQNRTSSFRVSLSRQFSGIAFSSPERPVPRKRSAVYTMRAAWAAMCCHWYQREPGGAHSHPLSDRLRRQELHYSTGPPIRYFTNGCADGICSLRERKRRPDVLGLEVDEAQ